MAKQTIGIGTTANDGTGDALRTAFTKVNNNFNELYSATGFNDMFLATAQTIPINTWTQVTFTGGTTNQNGSLNLLNSDGEITPITAGDVIQCDLAFEFEIPTINKFILIRLNVNGTIYGQTGMQMLRTAGTVETKRISFSIPVQQNFVDNNGYWEVFSDTAVDIENKYINVTRTHKAI